jgi:hypothetical protein
MEALLSHINTAFNKAYWVCGFLDRSELEAVLHRFYRSETSSPNFHAEQDEIALIYAVAAIGEYFDPGSPLPSEEINQIGDPKGSVYCSTCECDWYQEHLTMFAGSHFFELLEVLSI